MKKRVLIIFVLFLLTSLFFPSHTVFSQDDDFNNHPLNIWGFEILDSLKKEKDLDTLRSARDEGKRNLDNLVTYFEKNGNYHSVERVKRQRDFLLNYLDARVKKAEEDRDDYYRNVFFVIHAVLIDGADSVNENTPTEPNPVIDKILPVLQKQTKQNATDLLYGHVASQIPGSGAAISSSSPSQIYHVDAGLPSLSVPLVISNNGNSGGNDVNILKPLRFANGGLYDATVRAFSYTPAEGVTAGISRASTVVFRDSNPSAYLDLPLGTYVFCYDWDLGTDADKDGYVDYAHKNTGSVTLTVQSTDNSNSAQVVTLDPGNNQNGKCGETAPPPLGNSLSLTQQELANQGTHTYAMNCVCNGASALECDFWGGDWDPFGATIDFVEGGVNLTDEEGATYFQARLGVNTYDYADNMANGVLTFTDVGMIYSGDGLICTAIRR